MINVIGGISSIRPFFGTSDNLRCLSPLICKPGRMEAMKKGNAAGIMYMKAAKIIILPSPNCARLIGNQEQT
jgi:hypothetical protein